MKATLTPQSSTEAQESFELFKMKAKLQGYEYFIHCFSVEEDDEEVGWVCVGKEKLADLCLELSEQYCIYVERLSFTDTFSFGLN